MNPSILRNILNELLPFKFDESGNLYSTASLEGDVTINLTAAEALLTLIKTATQLQATTVSEGKNLVTETSSGAIKTAVEVLSALCGSGKMLVTETSSGAIKTAVEALSAIISGGKLGVLDTNSAAIKTAVEATKNAIDTINANLLTIKNDTDLKTYSKPYLYSEGGVGTGNGGQQTITKAGNRLKVSNNPGNIPYLTVAVNEKTAYILPGDSKEITTTQFSSFTITAPTSGLYTWDVESNA